MANYIAVVHKEAKSDFGVSFPEFSGCDTAGQTVDEAKDLGQEALGPLIIRSICPDKLILRRYSGKFALYQYQVV